jgi:diguanylate cyclase (GGDEF)-like protein
MYRLESYFFGGHTESTRVEIAQPYMEMGAVMKRSFSETRLLLLSSILAVMLIPLAVMLLQDGQWAAAILDFCIIWVMVGLFLHVLLHHETRLSGIVMAVVLVVGALGTLYLQGLGRIFWLYPSLTATFFLLSNRPALLLSSVAFLAMLAMVWEHLSRLELFTVSLTMLTTILFAFSFSLIARRQRAMLLHLATVDPLTGTGNRRAQNEKLDAVNALFRRDLVPCSVLIMDVDFFKKVNDTHGHIVGDEVLLQMADLIRSHTRPTENLYRYGGEEFIVIAEHTELEGAGQLAGKLRGLIEQYTFVSGIKLTVSFGVAELQRGEGRQGWLGRADGALFKAKGEGRNRVNLAASPLSELKPRVVAVGDS